ncbi:hypothetical protein HOLleu_37188 [Holothuria leucospilota]|uniref:Calx-beta domain-containing protein n=1 Tax=Holothuria leucospilota TaxID=206669 RepID=A0A9Q1BEK6_HOLLE|nr:hypothetical protein HOLleu_37188 [Holothuria leucospilota]
MKARLSMMSHATRLSKYQESPLSPCFDGCLEFTFADVAYTDGTALDGSDYTAIDSSFDFLTSATALSFSSSILDDSTVEDDETFFITVSNIGFPVGFVNTDGVVWEGTQTVTVKDEDSGTVYRIH